MVAEATVYVDVEGAVREWARDTLSGLSRRVFFGPSEDASLPYVSLYRIGGPDEACLVQFDVWGAHKAQAQSAAAALCTAISGLGRYEYPEANVLLHGASQPDSRWQPDEESGQPRYVVEATFTATALQ